MNKPTKPNITIPESFAANGVKADFDNNKILNGFDRIQPDVLAGDNLNKFIDDTYKGLNYGIKGVDYLEERWKSQLTNCLLEVPQRFKLTLANGVLTLKAGSEVIVPYGTEDLTSQYPKGATFLNDNFKVYDTQYADGKFFVWAEIQNNLSITYSGSTTSANGMFFIDMVSGVIYLEALVNIGSGTGSTTVPSYYNITTNNLTRNQTGTISLPFIECTFGTSITNSFVINNVFNGMGYIGSTIWVDKGVKGLISNGRDKDGTLRNIEYTTPNIFTKTYSAIVDSVLALDISDGRITSNYASDIVWNEYENIIYEKGVPKLTNLYIGYAFASDNKITSLQPKQTFRAVDYQEASGLGMPSNRYIDLTLGADGSTYTAPANGWFYLRKGIGTADAGVCDLNGNKMTLSLNPNINDYSVCAGFLPVLKGDTVRVSYNINGTTETFRFIYAEGEI